MSASNLVLILASAAIHVVAHVALKRARDRMAFVWWMLLWGVLLYSPVLLLERAAVPPSVWPIVAVSAVLEVAYFLSIARAYRLGDLSVVYPLARGTAPLFLLVWTALSLFGVADHLTVWGAAGVVLIAAGLYILNLPRLGAWL